MSLGVVTMFRDEARYLVEWVEYHRILGVGKFLLYDNDSEDDWARVLAPYVGAGLVEVVSWPRRQWVGDRRRQRQVAQVDAFRDGLARLRDVVDWVALIDVDEFLVPTSARTVPECLERWFRGTAAVYARWRMFGTSGVFLGVGEHLLPRLTSCSLASHPENSVGKTIVRPSAVDLDEIWYAHHVPLQGGARYADGAGAVLAQRARDADGLVDLVGVSGVGPDAQRGLVSSRVPHLRVNHYHLRDEGFFWSRRAPAAIGGLLGKDLTRLLEHRADFGLARDAWVISMLRRYHRADYERVWGGGLDSRSVSVPDSSVSGVSASGSSASGSSASGSSASGGS